MQVARLLGAAFLFGGCGAAPVAPDPASPAPQPAPPPSARPVEAQSEVEEQAEPLVVAIVVDQFAAWLARERLPQLPSGGGFARLQREGTYVTDLRYAHATTDTAPGHAALFTGAPPSLTGIYANQRLDPETGSSTSILSDPNSKLVSRAGIGTGSSSSARVIGVESVADRLRAARPEALIVSLSLKDRGAIFGAGQHPSACLWFDGKLQDFVSSDAFTTSFPAWALDTPTAIRPNRVASWEPFDASWVKAHTPLQDRALGEGALAGQTTSFPHAIEGAEHPELAFSVSPYGDEAVIDLAVAALEALPFGKQPGLLALSLSSTDYVGHIYGPDAWEWWDNFQRLDRELARLFTALDAKVGADGYAVVLSADHGTGVLPETARVAGARPWCDAPTADPFERPCTQGGRIALAPLVPELEAVARRNLGPGKWVLAASNPYIYLTQAALALPTDRRMRLDQALSAALARKPGVESIRLRPAKLEPCPPESDASLDALVCRSFAEAAGQFYVVTQPGWFLEAGYVPGFGANHGSHRLHDRSVPLLARAPGRIAPGQTVTSPQSFAMYSRTLSALLGIDAPEHAYLAATALELR